MEATGAKVAAHEDEADIINGKRERPSPFINMLWARITRPFLPLLHEHHPTQVDYMLDDGDMLPFSEGVRIIHTPGHTPGSICLYVVSSKVLIVGDALQYRFHKLSPPAPSVTQVTAFTYKLRVSGKENLKGLRGPVIFAANHHLYLDNAIVIKGISLNWRRRLAIAAAAQLWRSPTWAVLNPLLGNGFPFSKEGAVRASLDNLGRILDDGWSVLIYPEGELTIGGPLKPLKSGVGLISGRGAFAGCASAP